MNRTIISLAVFAALSGCASTPVMDAVTKAHGDVTKQVAAINASTDAMMANSIILPMSTVPYLPQKSVARGSYKAELPLILRSPKLVHLATKSPVSVDQFARLLAEEFSLPVKVEVDAAAASTGAGNADAAQLVDLAALPPMPLREFVTTVTRMLGTDWDWHDGTLLVQPAFTRTYAVSTSPDSNSGKLEIGKKGNASTGSGGGGGSTGNFNNEITSTTVFGTDAWKDLESGLKKIAGEKNVVLGKTFNVVTITCSKACHLIAKQFIDNANHSLNQQVLFKVLEITLATTSTGESGVDWNMVYRTVIDNRNYRFALGTPSSLVGAAAGAVQNILMPTASGSGNGLDTSSFLVKAISSASKFVDVKPYTTVVNNNETATLTNIEQQSYTESFTVVPATNLGGQPVYLGNPGTATFGQILHVRPTILPDGSIRVAFALDDTSGKVNKGAGVGVTDSVVSNAFNVNTKMTVQPGATMILSNFKRTTNRTNTQGLFEGQKLGSESGSQDTTETIILITPYLANAGAL